MSNYRELIAWQKALDLTDDIYSATEGFPVREQYGLSSQLRRSALSVPSNIAEGSGRLSSGEWIHFLGQARGSLYEAQTQLILARRRNFGVEPEIDRLIEACDEVARVLNGLLKSAARKFEAKKVGSVIRDGAPEENATEDMSPDDDSEELLTDNY